jgi:peptidylprolyl isomerase
VKIKNFLISIGVAVAVVGIGALAVTYMDEATVENETVVEPAAADPVTNETSMAEISLDGTAIDEATLEEILANLEAAETMPEVELDEAAMASFLLADMIKTASGLEYVVEEEGPGARPQAGDVVQVHYTGMLADGTTFDSSFNYDEPFAFPLGQGLVIPGWDEGIGLLPVGSKAKFIIPPELAYGAFGAGGVIPPNATLYFDVELLDILPGSPEAPVNLAEIDYTTTNSGLKYHDFELGQGELPAEGQVVKVHYTGWLADGTKFDSSLDRGMPFVFPVGVDYVIPGWDEGVATMKVGGKRQLLIPSGLAYGEEGAGEVIPPDATLVFEVELLEIES